MQSVYAVLRSRSDDLKKEEKFLLFNIRKSKDLYVLQLLLLLEIRELALEHIEIKKKKYLATEEDRNPNMRFIENRVLKAIEGSEEIREFSRYRKLNLWKENREYVRILLDQMSESGAYAEYMNSDKDGFELDRNFLTWLFREIVAPNEKLFDFYESTNLGWVDDYPLVNTMILKTFKQMKKNHSFDLQDLSVKEDDEEFLLDLFRKTLLHQDEFTEEIDAKTPNWDTERIADVDMILIKMALTEFLYFPSIPTKVTINEYIEIAKDYSTAKSSYFINGVLDKLLKDYNKSGKLKKIGRGLL
jgi:N utilization substance protein B